MESESFRRRLRAFIPLFNRLPGSTQDHGAAVFDILSDAIQQELRGSRHALARLEEFANENAWWRYLFTVTWRRIVREAAGRRDAPFPAIDLPDRDLATPLEVLLGQETLASLAREIKSLPRPERDVILLMQDGYIQSEIAKQLGLSARKVSRLVHSALGTLRRRLQE
jgi:RNA polymerase sigma factor (sigma-70 family)